MWNPVVWLISSCNVFNKTAGVRWKSAVRFWKIQFLSWQIFFCNNKFWTWVSICKRQFIVKSFENWLLFWLQNKSVCNIPLFSNHLFINCFVKKSLPLSHFCWISASENCCFFFFSLSPRLSLAPLELYLIKIPTMKHEILRFIEFPMVLQ